MPQLLDEELTILSSEQLTADNKHFVEGKDNLKFVYEVVEKRAKGIISIGEKNKILNNHGIDRRNAFEYYNSQYLEGSPEDEWMDVYQLLLAFVKRNPDADYFIDEMPILINKLCKLL